MQEWPKGQKGQNSLPGAKESQVPTPRAVCTHWLSQSQICGVSLPSWSKLSSHNHRPGDLYCPLIFSGVLRVRPLQYFHSPEFKGPRAALGSVCPWGINEKYTGNRVNGRGSVKLGAPIPFWSDTMTEAGSAEQRTQTATGKPWLERPQTRCTTVSRF